MTALDDPRPLDRDALLQAVYSIQADLKILVDILARDRHADLSNQTLMELSWFHFSLQRLTPSLRRH
jgi:hypothetical protein